MESGLHGKILVIDDDVLVRDTIMRILERRGYQVLVAATVRSRIGNMDFLDIAGKLGASEIISKPFDPSDLIALVSRCLDG